MPVWKKLLYLRSTSPLLFRALVLLFTVELSAVFIAPLILPNNIYLRGYLSDKAENSVQTFLHGENFLIPDTITGWRNKPDTSKDNWQVDKHGARSHRPVNLTPSKSLRVLFVGSSMINGGTHISNQETLSAYLEDENIEALNFGTMLFSFDQSLLLLEQLLIFKPDVVIMGLDSDPVAGLQNMYIPFRNPDEVNMPFLKPRFLLQGAQLQHLSIEPSKLVDLLEDDTILNFLKQHDTYYHRFERYIRMGHTPLAAGVNRLLRKAESFQQYLYGDPESEIILKQLMEKALALADAQGFKLFFLSMPSVSNIYPGRLMRYFPDGYAIRQQDFAAHAFPVIDVKQLFLDSGQNISSLYTDDQVHFTPIANQLIADALRSRIQAP